ncbi:MAG: amidohydrolase [Bacteroidales bacterium]|nr:amidohydrolase [Bacteroidales bacterium]
MSAQIKAIPTNRSIHIESGIDNPRYRIIDSHLHFTDFLQNTDGFAPLCRAMDLSGVTESVVFGMGISKQWDGTIKTPPTYYLSDDCRCYYYSGTDFIVAEELLAQPDEIRDRFFPFICGVNGNDLNSVDHIRRLLRLYPGFWCGIGEIMSRHDELTALTYGEPPHINGEGFLRIFDLAAEESLPVLVHHNVTSQYSTEFKYVDELEEALAHNRDCKIIWAHVGISRRVEVRGLIDLADRLLAENPNLFIDISWVVYDYYFLDMFPSRYSDGDTLEDWVRFIEKNADRIMIGSDTVGHWNKYPAEILKYYDLLDRLNPATTRKIGYENILSLIRRPARSYSL